MDSPAQTVVAARAPAKINLILRVGSPDDSGYHPLVTVFQALDMWDEVAISPATADQLEVVGPGDLSGVPTDSTNIVWGAVEALARIRGHRDPLHITITKTIPVAGGMAGGSADAAATLVALNELWQLGMTTEQLAKIAAHLGADVPFSLLGGLAIGEGRGDVLTPLSRMEPIHCVVVPAELTLSTPRVYTTLDQLRAETHVVARALTDDEVARVTGNATRDLVSVVENDLQTAALACAPTVQGNLDAAREAGALVALVSGSGPTVWGLCQNSTHATEVAQVLRGRGVAVWAVESTPLGAHLISSRPAPTAVH